MQRIPFVLFVLLQFIALNGLVCAQQPGNKEIQRIDTYCKSVDKYVDGRAGPDLVFADTSGDAGGKPKWKKFASPEALDAFRETSETYSIAYAWRQNGRLTAAYFTYFSGSGDWAKYVNHCFRADGSLAKVSIDYRTFYGDFILLKDMYFNMARRLLKIRSKTLDLATHKPTKVSRENMEENANKINSVDYYKSVGKLPFAHLLKTKRK